MSQNELGQIIPPAGPVSLPINEALPPRLSGMGKRKKNRKNKKDGQVQRGCSGSKLSVFNVKFCVLFRGHKSD